MMNKKQVTINLTTCFVFLLTTGAMAEPGLEGKLDQIYQSAAEAIQKEDVVSADFWIARYLGLSLEEETDTEKRSLEMIGLVKSRKDLKGPTAILSAKYAESFLDFYREGAYEMWGVPDGWVNAKDHEVVIAEGDLGPYLVQVQARPVIEVWNFMNDTAQRWIALPLADTKKPPKFLLIDKSQKNPVLSTAVLNTEERFIQYFWPLEAHDLDGDGKPELWVRYNAAWATGFSQILEIYRVKDGKSLELIQRFEGLAEGIARRLPSGKIEVAESYSSTGSGAHLEFDRHRIETWEYKDGKFVKISERTVPHILLDDNWQNYYFTREE